MCLLPPPTVRWKSHAYVEGRDNKQKVKTLSGAILILLGRGDVAGEFTSGDVMVYHCWSMVLIGHPAAACYRLSDLSLMVAMFNAELPSLAEEKGIVWAAFSPPPQHRRTISSPIGGGLPDHPLTFLFHKEDFYHAKYDYILLSKDSYVKIRRSRFFYTTVQGSIYIVR